MMLSRPPPRIRSHMAGQHPAARCVQCSSGASSGGALMNGSRRRDEVGRDELCRRPDTSFETAVGGVAGAQQPGCPRRLLAPRWILSSQSASRSASLTIPSSQGGQAMNCFIESGLTQLAHQSVETSLGSDQIRSPPLSVQLEWRSMVEPACGGPHRLAGILAASGSRGTASRQCSAAAVAKAARAHVQRVGAAA